MMTLIWAVVAILAVCGCCIAVLAYVQINGDGNYTSEAYRQAQDDAARLMREANK